MGIKCKQYLFIQKDARSFTITGNIEDIDPVKVEDKIVALNFENYSLSIGDTTPVNKVPYKINSIFECKVSRLEFFQHPLENFPEYVESPPQHIDARFEFSGVLYLDHGDIGLGTTIGDQYIEWKPNRLVTFDALTPHNPHMGGLDRKVLTFFSYKSK